MPLEPVKRVAPRLALVLGLLGLSACEARGPRRVVVQLPEDVPRDAAQIRFEPPSAVKAAHLDAAGNLALDTDGSAFTVRLPEACPVEVPAHTGATDSATGGTTFEVGARPLLRLEGNTAQVGYDRPFTLTAARGCEAARRGQLAWRQVEGPPLPTFAVSADGAQLSARTLPRGSFLPDPLPPGVVAVSPRTQGRYVVEVTLTGAGGPVVRRAVTVTSIARATGLSSLAVSQRVMLGGSGWRVERGPPGSHARLDVVDGVSLFTPDVPGRWTLRDDAGHALGLQALTHDRTPLDCGRAECHAAISSAATHTPMSDALRRPGRVPAAARPSGCLLDCHVTGERGLRDGGFLDVASALGVAPEGVPYEALPRALQRLGGVRCTSCHGPGAIPEAAGRSRVLRADVCATCHDAPPAYTHVEEWRRSRMASADRDPTARSTPACARCHTTGGFLHAMGARRRDDRSRDPDDAVVGVACAACHDVHGDHAAPGAHALLRDGELPATPGVERPPATRSVCAGCHTPDPDEPYPSATSATIVAGRARLPASLGGEEQRGPSPHATLPGGCTACHGASVTLERHVDHQFQVDKAICARCHAGDARDVSPAAHRLAERAAALLAELSAGCEVLSSGTPHAAGDRLASCRLPTPRARAVYLAALVAGDRGAAAHNPAFAASLLDLAAATASVPRR